MSDQPLPQAFPQRPAGPLRLRLLKAFGAAPVRRLALIVILANLLVLALVAVSLQASHELYRERAEINSRNTNRLVSQSISDDIDRLDQCLLAVIDEHSRQLALGSLDKVSMNAFLYRQKARLPMLDALRIADASGDVVLGSDTPLPSGVSIADRDYFSDLKNATQSGLLISKPVVGRISGKPVLIFSRPLGNAEGGFAGTVFAPVALDWFEGKFRKLEVGAKGTVVLRGDASRDFDLLARVPHAGFVGQTKVSEQFRSRITAQPQGGTYEAFAGADNIRRTFTYGQVPGQPLITLVGLATEDIFADWWREVAKLMSLASIFALLTSLGAAAVFRAWRARAAAYDQFHSLLTSAGAGIFGIDRKGVCSFANPAAISLLGLNQENELLGRDVGSLIRTTLDPSEAERQPGMIAAMEGTPCGVHVDNEFFLRADGSPLPVEYWSRPRFENGELSGAVVTFADISARIQAEKELENYRLHLEEQVAERTEALSLAKDSAEAANRAKSSFLANMSHEIRTPMNAILGLTHLLRKAETRPTQQDQLDKVSGAGKHLLRVINDILDLAKIEAGKLELEKENFPISSVLDQVHSLVAHTAHVKGLAVTIDYQDAPTWLLGDSSRLRQAMLNFAGNAVKFTERGGITLRSRVMNRSENTVHLRFEVEDTGIGISEAELARLFQPFEQADISTTRKFGGTGLGLTITKRLATLMGGEVGVESKPGEGSTFWFTATLEVGSEALSAEQKVDSVRDAEGLLRRLHGGAKLLLVEDDLINREVALLMLVDTGFQVDQASDGRQAVQMVSTGNYDLILMDMQMPVMDGLEATRRIRELANGKEIPILAMTANAFADDREKCLAAGMNDFVSKPVNPEVFFSTLLKWMGR